MKIAEWGETKNREGYELPIRRNAMTKQIIHTYIRGEKNKQRKKKNQNSKFVREPFFFGLCVNACVI